MTPKEKAAYLILKYMSKVVSKQVAKECALVAVDEILNELDHTPFADDDYCEWKMNYWQEVKQEIEKA